MTSLLLLTPAISWLLSLAIFLTILKAEYPEAYRELNLISALFKGKEDDAARTLSFFWHQKHQRLGRKVALAGKVLNVIFILCVIAMVVIFWFGWAGRV